MNRIFTGDNKHICGFVLLFFIIIIQICVILHFTFERHNLFVDEVWTFNMANHYYFPFSFQSTEPYLKTWLPASFWQNSLVADPNHTFNYDSVFYNQSIDNHPPFYYIVIHTVCSLFPGKFSRWFGIVPNLVFFVLVQLTFYSIGLKLFKKKSEALVLCLLYGSCWGTINNVMLIRMYVMLTFFALLSYYAHLQLLDNVENQDSYKKPLISIFVFSICGFLTHYYYLIYAFYLFSGTVVLLFLRHKKHTILQYFLTLLGALISCVIINPCIPAQFIGTTGEHGAKTWHYLVQPDFMKRITVMFRLISQDLIDQKVYLFIFLIAVLFLAKIVLNVLKIHIQDVTDTISAVWEKESRSFSFSIHFNTIHSGTFLAAVTATAYFLSASKIVPYYEHRYMYIIYPFIVICLFSVLSGLLQSLTLKRGLALTLTTMIFLGLNIHHYNRKNIKFLDDSYPKMLATIRKDYSDVNMITVCNSPNWWPVVNNIFVYQEVPNTLMINESQLSEIKQIVKNLPSNPHIFLAYRGFTCKITPREFIKTVNNRTGFAKYRQIHKSWWGEIYLFSQF